MAVHQSSGFLIGSRRAVNPDAGTEKLHAVATVAQQIAAALGRPVVLGMQRGSRHG
jgi:hypothetical protein